MHEDTLMQTMDKAKKVTSFRLRKDQAERIKRTGQPSAVVSYAVRRLRRGDFDIDRAEDSVKGAELVLVPFYGRPAMLTSHEVRLALDRHFSTQDAWLEKEIERARKDAEMEWARLRAKGPVIIEEAK